MTKKAPDKIDEARRLLASIEADLRVESDKLHQLRTTGADHFRRRLAWAHHKGLTENNVDAWLAEASGVAKVTK